MASKQLDIRITDQQADSINMQLSIDGRPPESLFYRSNGLPFSSYTEACIAASLSLAKIHMPAHNNRRIAIKPVFFILFLPNLKTVSKSIRL